MPILKSFTIYRVTVLLWCFCKMFLQKYFILKEIHEKDFNKYRFLLTWRS